jgi:hypothetical protein
MELKVVLGIFLILCLFFVSIPFETRYAKFLSQSAHNSGMQFLAGMILITIASIDPILAALALLVIFLWIADVKLLSSTRIAPTK